MAATLAAALGVPTVAGAEAEQGPAIQLEVNRPRSVFDCNTPRGEQWYGSTDRCLEELCAGKNVYNEFIFQGSRRRRNPCYGRSPTEFEDR